MTIIAWDGETLAADRRGIVGDMIINVGPKIFELNGMLVGLAGNSTSCAALLAWFRVQDKAAPWPKSQEGDSHADMLIVLPGGDLWKFDTSPEPIHLRPQQIAIGSGREFAMGAMEMGATAVQAVEATIRRCWSCGDGVDALRFPE